MLQSDRGLVLRTYKLRETSKIASVLGFANGRVRLVAHGGRGGRHRFGACLEPGNEVEIVYSFGPGRELGTLREATLRKAHLAGATRLDALGTGLAVIELLDRLVPEGAAEPGLPEQATIVLGALGAAPDRATALLLFYSFECRLLSIMGLEPHLQDCAACGRPAGTLPGVLDVRDAALRCRSCPGGVGPGRLPLSAEAARLLAAVASKPGEEIATLASTPRQRRLVGLCLHRLLTAHLERYRYPRSLALLKKVDRTPGVDRPPEAGSGFRTLT